MVNLFERVVAESPIFQNRNIMLPSYMPDRLPFREKQIEAMVSTLSVCLKNNKPDNLFLYGKPGTGKTCCTKYVLNQLEEFVKKNALPVRINYMNCRHYNSKYKVLSRIVQKLYPDKEFVGYSGTFIYENLLRYCEENESILIIGLDEIDKVKDLDELMYALTRANDDLLLMLRAGELAEKEGLTKVTDSEVKRAKEEVEEEIVMDMVSTLPEQQQLVLYAIACLTTEKKGIKRFTDSEPMLYSGEVYDEYKKIAARLNTSTVSTRWFQEYINELEMYGILLTTNSGKGFKGQSRLIKLGFDGGKIKKVIEKQLLS